MGVMMNLNCSVRASYCLINQSELDPTQQHGIVPLVQHHVRQRHHRIEHGDGLIDPSWMQNRHHRTVRRRRHLTSNAGGVAR